MRHRCVMLRAIIAGLLIATLLFSPAGLNRLEAAVFGGTIDTVAPEQKSLVIKLGTSDKTQTVRLDPAAKITLDGKPVALADLQPGHRASVFTTNDLATRITARAKRQSLSLPSLPIVRWQTRAARSAPCLTEQISAESASGSIGTTRSGK